MANINRSKITLPKAKFQPDVYLHVIQNVANTIFQKYLESQDWEKKKMEIYFNEFIKINKKLDLILQETLKRETPDIIITEQMNKENAKKKVLSFMKKNKTADIETLHKAIRCDIRLLIEIVDELISEGKIGE